MWHCVFYVRQFIQNEFGIICDAVFTEEHRYILFAFVFKSTFHLSKNHAALLMGLKSLELFQFQGLLQLGAVFSESIVQRP